MNAVPEFSVILPFFNEAAVLEETLEAVLHQLHRLDKPFELICIDDGSADDTGALLDTAANQDGRIRPVHFSRNFGKEAAMTAGLSISSGKAVILLDGDLQHPPDIIPRLVQRWREGFDVVNAIKVSRPQEGWFYRLMVGLFNGIMARSCRSSFRGNSDFKLLDREVVDAVLMCPERNRFFRGLVAWVGFRVSEVPFEVGVRPAGETKWSIGTLIGYSVGNMLAFTALPLKVIAVVGFAVVITGLILAAHTLYNVYIGVAVTGFATVILSIVVFSGLILSSLGVLSLYVAQIYDEQKRRPLFIVRKQTSVSPGPNS